MAQSVGADGKTIGEVVFNTAMTGYQEILTDPSYCRQIVTLTYPHIGNTGTNSVDMESSQIHASGLIIREASMLVSSWRAERDFRDFLKGGDTVAIADIDTRKLTRLIREKGAQSGCIMTGDVDPETAIDHARKFPVLSGWTSPSSYRRTACINGVTAPISASGRELSAAVSLPTTSSPTTSVSREIFCGCCPTSIAE